jgi:hypothetical protein
MDATHVAVIQEINLGWILLSRIPKEGADRSTALFICNEPPIDFKLQRFWEQEEIGLPMRTKEEEAVERYFMETSTRDETGRFVVRLRVIHKIFNLEILTLQQSTGFNNWKES